MVRRLFRLILILALPVAMFAPTTASAAHAPAVSIHIVNQGELVSGGVVVTVDYSCLFGTGTVFAQVTQGPAGGGSAPATCDNHKHQVSIFVPGAFTAGSASALAIISSSAGNANTGFVEIQIK